MILNVLMPDVCDTSLFWELLSSITGINCFLMSKMVKSLRVIFLDTLPIANATVVILIFLLFFHTETFSWKARNWVYRYVCRFEQSTKKCVCTKIVHLEKLHWSAIIVGAGMYFSLVLYLRNQRVSLCYYVVSPV